VRELSTRIGRENIGFLWMMVEPLLFPVLVGVLWRFLKGPEEHGISIIAYVVSGYVPLTLFRHVISRATGVFTANSSLMYHRQIRLLDFILVRFLIEFIGSMMSYFFIAAILFFLGLFPVPADFVAVFFGMMLYALLSLAFSLVLAPLTEMSEILEKFIPVTTYVMIPFSGTFNQVSWLPPKLQDVMLWSPFVDAMELMRYGIFGDQVDPRYDLKIPVAFILVFLIVGMGLCSSMRKRLVVE
jgi:capsular polysaccharide transport system permease protein